MHWELITRYFAWMLPEPQTGPSHSDDDIDDKAPVISAADCEGFLREAEEVEEAERQQQCEATPPTPPHPIHLSIFVIGVK